jgi:hypothetical protein
LQLQIATAGVGDVDDQRQRLLQERLDLVGDAEIQQRAIKVALAADVVYFNVEIRGTFQAPHAATSARRLRQGGRLSQ